MPRGHCWSPEEVRLLLAEIRGSGGVRLLMASTSRPNEALWRDICGELAAQGYPRNVAQCRAKWKKMKQAFYSERAARRQGQGGPQGLCSPRYYGLLRRLWKQAGRPVFGERRLPDAKNREAQTVQQEARSGVTHWPSSEEEEYGRQTWPESKQTGLEENQSSASEGQDLSPAQRRQWSPTRPEVQVKEKNEEEESDISVPGYVTSGGEQEMSDLSYSDLSPAQRSPSQPEPVISHQTADASTSPLCRQIKIEPQSDSSPLFPTLPLIASITSCGQPVSMKQDTKEKEAEKVHVKKEEAEEEEESDLSTTPAWDTTSVGDQETSNLSYSEFSISREAVGIYPSPVHHHLKSEAQNHCSPCFPTLPISASVTSFVPSLSIKQETTEKEADAPPEHGASPAAGAGTMLGEQVAAADMQGGSVVSLLQSMQQILTQLLHTSQQQQVLLESLANDTVSHLSLISDNLVHVGETLQEMLLKAHHRNRVE